MSDQTFAFSPSALVRTPPVPLLSLETGGYCTSQELCMDQLVATRMRVAAASEQLDAFAQDPRVRPTWPADLLAIERRIDARLLATVEPLPIVKLRDRFALTATEMRTLWLLIGIEMCPVVRSMTRALSAEPLPDPTIDAIRRIVYGACGELNAWHELGPEGTLRKFGFIARGDESACAADHRQTWKVTSRVLALAYGAFTVDPALASLVTSAHHGPALDDLLFAGDAALQIAAGFDRGDLVLVHGRVGSGRRSSLVATARSRGLGVLVIDGRAVDRDAELARRQLRLVARECCLLGLIPLIKDLDLLAGTSEVPDRIEIVEQEVPGLVLATSTKPIARRWRRAPTSIELAPLSGAQRAALWRRAIPTAGRGDAGVLATTYPIAPALIEAAGRLAIERCGNEIMRPEHIQAALRSVLDDRLAGLAKRVNVTQNWDDIVLPDDQTTSIIELLARVRERTRVYEDWGFADKVGRGLGVAALFSGPPGTGKTMAAGLVARALRVEMYQVDVSKIVSKWIGETEKNLATLFDAAEAGHAILLFDEADALFGKRTDVKSSNDRHANQEVNFLLQRLETFTGICILTTNHETAIDEAFRRRLSVHVRFPMPEAPERARLWKALLPENAPRTGPLDFDALAATYAMSGGYIRNAVLRAAFLAADESAAIDGSRLARAAQLEYEALGKVVTSKP